VNIWNDPWIPRNNTRRVVTPWGGSILCKVADEPQLDRYALPLQKHRSRVRALLNSWFPPGFSLIFR
jgi:hypothetical protein